MKFVNPGKGFRLLKRGEILQAGDEFSSLLGRGWLPINAAHFGRATDTALHDAYAIRRRDNETNLGGERE